MSVDFTLPRIGITPTNPEGLSIRYVPLSLVKKEVLRALDVRNQNGDAVPVMTQSENAGIASRILAIQAAQVLDDGEALHPEITKQFDDIAGVPQEPDPAALALADPPNDKTAHERPSLEQRATDALYVFQAASHLKDDDIPTDQRRRLWRDGVMNGLLRELKDEFILLAGIAVEPGRRHIIKFSYEEELTKSGGGDALERAGQALGLRDYSIELHCPGLFDAASYHIEVEAPEELVIAKANLVLRTKRIEPPFASPTEKILSSSYATDRAHLFGHGPLKQATHELSEKGLYQEAMVEVDFALRPSLLWPALLISYVTTGMFVCGLLARVIENWHARPDAAALVVAIPAFFAAYLVPGEHRLVRQMFFLVRSLVFASGLLSFAAAAALAIDIGGGRTNWWIGLAIGSVVVSVLLTMALGRSRGKITPPSDGRVT